MTKTTAKPAKSAKAKPATKTSKKAPTGLQVFKFGGTSVGSAEAIRLATGHVMDAAPHVAVVVSAMSTITDTLIDGVKAARTGDNAAVDRAALTFVDRHQRIITELVRDRELRDDLLEYAELLANEYRAIGQSVFVLRELSPRTLDAAVARGERLSCRVFAAVLADRGMQAKVVDATDIIVVKQQNGQSWPDFPAIAENAKRVRAGLKGQILVMPGYIGRGVDGQVVTLGRGGSDFSAAILARALSASRVVLYKEVDGLLTADPRWVKQARIVPEMHYREAAELAYYGAKVLHPRTMIPLIDVKIPLHIKNTFNGAFAGTRISSDAVDGAFPVKALTAISQQVMISIEGNGMMGVPGVAGRAFGALSAAGHSVAMISQASSESSICFVLPSDESKAAVQVLQQAFAIELTSKLIDSISVNADLALVAIVGLGMRGTKGIAARAFTALGQANVNIVAIAQGSSELNITVAVRASAAQAAVQALHDEFQLERIRPLQITGRRRVELSWLGFGQIGQALARQLIHQARYFEEDVGIDLIYRAVSDRSGLIVDDAGLDLAELIARKAAGKPLVKGGKADAFKKGAFSKLWSLPSERGIFVDVTADETAPLIKEALLAGHHVVVANKKPLAIAQAGFDELFAIAKQEGLKLRYEATVGAGLPVLDTFKKLHEAGDQVETVLGCFSGTLGFLMTQLEDGVAFSQAVRTAKALGYTEPDPRDDLSGLDVGRKALILARTLGYRLDLSDVSIESLFPAQFGKGDAQKFMTQVEQLDGEYQGKLKSAQSQNQVLRYVAHISKKGVKVGLQAVPRSSPLAGLRGTDNQVTLYTKRYKTNPLVVTGPGAGAEVTAAGVLNDIMAIATS